MHVHKAEETFQTHLQRKSAQTAPMMLNEKCNVSDSKVHMHAIPSKSFGPIQNL